MKKNAPHYLHGSVVLVIRMAEPAGQEESTQGPCLRTLHPVCLSGMQNAEVSVLFRRVGSAPVQGRQPVPGMSKGTPVQGKRMEETGLTDALTEDRLTGGSHGAGSGSQGS